MENSEILKLTIEKMTDAMMDMAKAYNLGTPESRAIVTAIEHSRVVVSDSMKSYINL